MTSHRDQLLPRYNDQRNGQPISLDWNYVPASGCAAAGREAEPQPVRRE